ncbi:hypothetical protein MHBO_004116, partial [Bonamia ostreae]
MSMIGYVLGVGDRHLWNILLHLKTGKIAHIDYNVCFDKGKRLAIPETVPFRFTKIFRGAISPSNINLFKSTCCKVLVTMRQNRKTLIAILSKLEKCPLENWRKSCKKEILKVEEKLKNVFEIFAKFSLFELFVNATREFQ